MSAHVLHVVNELCQASSNLMVANLCQGLRERGYTVSLASLGPADEGMSARLGELGIEPAFVGRGGPLGAVRQLARLVRDRGVGLVHTHVLRADLLGALGARLGGECPVVSTKHNTGYVPGQRGWRVRNALYGPSARLADHLVTVSHAQRHELAQRFRLDPARVTTIYAGLDTERFWRPDARDRIRRSLGIAEGEVVIMYAGRLVGGKGLETLLDSAPVVLAECPEAHFVIVGDGYLAPKLRAAAESRGLSDRVTFTGFRRDIPELLAGADVFTLPSRSEGLPLGAVEAMAAGKPLVATAVGGLAELVQDGVTGLEVPVDDAAGLAEALVRLARNPALRERMGEAGRRFVQGQFSVETMVAAHDALYRQLLAGRAVLAQSQPGWSNGRISR